MKLSKELDCFWKEQEKLGITNYPILMVIGLFSSIGSTYTLRDFKYPVGKEFSMKTIYLVKRKWNGRQPYRAITFATAETFDLAKLVIKNEKEVNGHTNAEYFIEESTHYEENDL